MTDENRWTYAKVDINLINEAEENANIMSEADFNTLCDNIGASGLSSVPTCYKKDDGRFIMISGHHRLRACKKLGYKRIGILYALESSLSKDEIIAIQLSHNSLHGEDDKGILRSLFSQIQNVDFKRFAHVNIDEIGSINANTLSFSPFSQNYTIGIILYKDSKEAFDELIGDVQEMSSKNDVVIIANGEETEEEYLRIKKILKDEKKIKSSNIAFVEILKLAYKQLKEERNDLGDND